MVLDPNVPHVAYFVGLAQTDGHHSGDLRGKGRLEIELSARDAAVLERLAALLPCYASVGRRTRTTNFSRSRVHETAILRIYDRTVRRELAALGVVVGPKSDKVAPPPVPCSRTDYWRGVVDGDGSLGFTAAGRPFVSLVSASPALTQGFADLLHDVTGAVRTPRPNTRDGVVNLMVQSNEAAALARWLYPDGCELALTRKRDQAARVRAWRPPAGSEHRYGVRQRAWTPQDDSVVLDPGLTQAEAARRLDRTMSSVSMRRWRLRQIEQG